MSLLAHRGSMRRRGRPGFLQQFGATLRTALGGRRDATIPRGRTSRGGLAVVGAVLACVGTGYLLGNVFPWHSDGTELRVGHTGQRTGIAPGPLGETEDFRPLASQCFLTAAYEELAPAAAAAKALRQAGLGNARLQEIPLGEAGKLLYGLVVYYDGPRDREQARAALGLVTAPDATFEHYRKKQKDWPLVKDVR